MFGFDTSQLVGITLSAFLPLVVAFVTKESWPSPVKTTALAGLTAVTGVVTTLVDPATNVHWQEAVWTVLVGWAVAVATHKGAWLPSGLAAALAKRGVKDPTPPPSAGVPSGEPLPATVVTPPAGDPQPPMTQFPLNDGPGSAV
jgi:hypothetical protein